MQPDKVIKMSFNWKLRAYFFFYRNCIPIPSDRSVEHVQLHLFTEMSGTPQDLTVIIRRDQSNLIYHATIRLCYLQYTNVPSRQPVTILLVFSRSRCLSEFHNSQAAQVLIVFLIEVTFSFFCHHKQNGSVFINFSSLAKALIWNSVVVERPYAEYSVL